MTKMKKKVLDKMAHLNIMKTGWFKIMRKFDIYGEKQELDRGWSYGKLELTSA